MLLMVAFAFAAVEANDGWDPEPWKDEKVCAWRRGMSAIEMVPARTRKLWKGSSYRVEGLVTVDGTEMSYADVYKSSEFAPWASEKMMTFRGRTYAKYGLPRILDAADTVPIGDQEGVAVSAEASAASAAAVPEVVYVMHRGLECEFQPYELKN